MRESQFNMCANLSLDLLSDSEGFGSQKRSVLQYKAKIIFLNSLKIIASKNKINVTLLAIAKKILVPRDRHSPAVLMDKMFPYAYEMRASIFVVIVHPKIIYSPLYHSKLDFLSSVEQKSRYFEYQGGINNNCGPIDFFVSWKKKTHTFSKFCRFL